MDASVVISTYNRSALLRETLDDVLKTMRAVTRPWEVVIVDNNSTDDTRALVESIARQESRVRYVFEGRQGVCYGRNAGIAAARGRIVLFTDDDIVLGPDWAAKALVPFADERIGFVMGKVLPLFDAPRPPWLHPEITGPIAMCDAGDEILHLGENPPCLPFTANLAVRREALERIGGFNPELGMRGRDGRRGVRTGDDHDLGIRLIEAGFRGLYLPSLVTYNRLTVERLTKRWVRTWMFASGEAYSIMGRGRERHLRHWLGVPGFMYWRVVRNASHWAWAVLRRRRDEMFLREVRLCSAAGFFFDRWRLSGDG